jgi:hypothetical protein
MFWGFCLLMAVALQNMTSNVHCPTSSPNFEIMGLLTDAESMANHYFGKVAVVTKTGFTQKKVSIGVTRNEMGIVIGVGSFRNKSWLIYRLGQTKFRPVERADVKSITIDNVKQLTQLSGLDFMPIVDKNNVTTWKIRSTQNIGVNGINLDVGSVRDIITQEDKEDGVIMLDEVISSLPRHLPVPPIISSDGLVDNSNQLNDVQVPVSDSVEMLEPNIPIIEDNSRPEILEETGINVTQHGADGNDQENEKQRLILR